MERAISSKTGIDWLREKYYTIYSLRATIKTSEMAKERKHTYANEVLNCKTRLPRQPIVMRPRHLENCVNFKMFKC